MTDDEVLIHALAIIRRRIQGFSGSALRELAAQSIEAVILTFAADRPAVADRYPTVTLQMNTAKQIERRMRIATVLHQGDATASEIRERSGLGQVETYRTLKKDKWFESVDPSQWPEKFCLSVIGREEYAKEKAQPPEASNDPVA